MNQQRIVLNEILLIFLYTKCDTHKFRYSIDCLHGFCKAYCQL